MFSFVSSDLRRVNSGFGDEGIAMEETHPRCSDQALFKPKCSKEIGPVRMLGKHFGEITAQWQMALRLGHG